jgi:glucose-6-phosphate isomerase
MWPDFDYKNRALAITLNSSDNDLRLIAIDKEMRIIDHHPNIGGRFSVFSVVGLLPALIAGVDINLLIEGAKRAISEKEKICEDTRTVIELIKNGVNEHVVFSYSDFMFGFGKWVIQLVSESLGKKNDFGLTVVNATGAIDQHSMLQLFLGGPNNRYYTVITQKNNVITKKVKANNYLNGHNIHELMLAHQKATIESLKEKAHVRVFEFEELSEEALGYMMMLSFIETICIADSFEINAFDQPAVEASKKLAIKYLNETN